MEYLTDITPPPPPYSSHGAPITPPLPQRPTQTTSDYDICIQTVPTTVSNLPAVAPSAPSDIQPQDTEASMFALIQEACKYQYGSRLEMKQSKLPLILYQSWAGRACQLYNRRSNMIVHGSVIAHDSIRLENSKGNIMIDGSIVAGKNIDIKINRGQLITQGVCLLAKDTMSIQTSSNPLQLQSMLEAKQTYVKVKKAPLILSQVTLISHLEIRATKSSVEIYIVDFKNSSGKIKITATHAPVRVYLSRQFSGHFLIQAKKNVATFIDHTHTAEIKYKKTDTCHLEGTFKHGKKAKHGIHIKTSYAPAFIHIV